MAQIYEQSFSASLDDNGAQKAMPLPALTKGTAYTFTVGFNSWQSYWDNPSNIYMVNLKMHLVVFHSQVQIKN